MIHDSRLWNLYLAPDTDRIEVMAYCPIGDHSLLAATVPLSSDTTTVVGAFEEAVYDNPLLLNDFNRVTIISRSDMFTVMPTGLVADKDMVTDIVSEMTGARGGALIVDDLPLLEASVCHLIDPDLHNFINRTFNQPRFIHRLSGLTRYYH
ncbi:MAG: DUF3822 family protein, partial [Muribaculaceae bacterium]|nr:DUF3822 family protein [Muribaculaceae bacterium]